MKKNIKNSNMKKYLFICDFDKTLSFNDSGVLLSEKVGISEEEFERSLTEVRKRNITPLGGKLAYLITKQLFKEVGIQVKLKKNVSNEGLNILMNKKKHVTKRR